MASTKDLVMDTIHNNAITSEILDSAAKLFSNNYSVWPNGKRVRMSTSKLRQDVCAQEAHNMYIRATLEGDLVGHVFACEWICGGQHICWVTQLVVKQGFRNQGIAKSMLGRLRQQGLWDCVGILSSHPFAIMAVLRTFSGGIEGAEQDMEHTKACGAAVMASSPIKYVREAVLDDSLDCAFTNFFVDHGEPDEALESLRGRNIAWPLGTLPRGHEFLIAVAPNEWRRSIGSL